MEKVSRRSFIKTGTIATIGLGILPNSANASKEADKQVKIGVIGTGNRGTGHINNLLAIDGIEIVAVCDLVAIQG